jgi:predicted transcriptional regulator YdeE
MQIITQSQPITIAGLSIRTSNSKAFDEIPAHWGAFFTQQVLAQIPDKINDEVYAVYTEFDRIPADPTDIASLGYTFVIGVAVSSTLRLSAPMVSTVIPAAKRAVFPVQPAQPDQVGGQWQKIWQMQKLPRTFAPDYEHYAADGAINILVSIA